jgi:hypothetical protein
MTVRKEQVIREAVDVLEHDARQFAVLDVIHQDADPDDRLHNLAYRLAYRDLQRAKRNLIQLFGDSDESST